MKKPASLPKVEKVLKAMNFQVTHAHNYDPKGIISQRRVQVQKSIFIHSMILDLSQEENSLSYDFNWNPVEKMHAPKYVEGMVPATSLPKNGDGCSRRSRLEVEDM